MPNPIQIELSDSQRAELEDVRDHAPEPYLRERASAIIKIADGRSGRDVALNGCIKPRWPDTIYEWVKRYEEEGIEEDGAHDYTFPR